MMGLEEKKQRVVDWFHLLQEEICEEFIAIEEEGARQTLDIKPGFFEEKNGKEGVAVAEKCD